MPIDVRAACAFERHEVTATISFRTALETVETIARHPWLNGHYFSLRDAEILEQAGANIREKVAAVAGRKDEE